MNRTCIIVSPYFPPSNLAGVHRARHLAKHLPSTGWTPVVVCVHERFHEERLDPDLATLIPATVEIRKVSAIPAQFCRPLGLGEISLRAWRPLRSALLGLLQSRPVDVVLITGSPYYPMLMAAEIKRRFGVPVVLDFQDPWVSAWGATQPAFSKSGISHRLSVRLEPKALHAASFITSVSDTQNEEMAARYPWLDRSRMAAIPIGGDTDDYAALRAAPLDDAGLGLGDHHFHISYVGTIWPPVVDTVRAFFRGARLVRERSPENFDRLRLNFIGTTAAPNNTSGFLLKSIAEAEGVAEIVQEIPQRLPYLQALSIQANSDAILMLGSNEPHYTASKTINVLMAGRPYLSVLHEFNGSHDVLKRAGGGLVIAFSARSDLPRIEPQIADAIVTLASGKVTVEHVEPVAYSQLTARSVASAYAGIFNQVAALRRSIA